MGLLSEIVLLLIIHLLTSLISFLSTNHFELFADILTFFLFLIVNIFFLELLLFVNYSVVRNLLHLDKQHALQIIKKSGLMIECA